MTPQQFQYMSEIVRQSFRVGRAAVSLGTSQPNVSKQIRSLEKELGFQIFERTGKRLTGMTGQGREVWRYAERILRDVTNIRRISEDYASDTRGVLTVATTPTLASYVLPSPVEQFVDAYPEVSLQIVVGETDQNNAAVVAGQTDIAVVPRMQSLPSDVVALTWLTWERVLIALPDCGLLSERVLTLAKIAKYPVIAFETPAVSLKRVFNAQGLSAEYPITTSNPDVMKAYAALGLGVGIIASATYDATRDAPLVARSVSHLIPAVEITVTLRKEAYLRRFAYRFMNMLAPELTRGAIDDKVYQARSK